MWIVIRRLFVSQHVRFRPALYTEHAGPFLSISCIFMWIVICRLFVFQHERFRPALYTEHAGHEHVQHRQPEDLGAYRDCKSARFLREPPGC